MRKILLLILSLVFSAQLLAQPSFTSASYDEKTSVLTLNFDQIVQFDNVILHGIQIIPGGILTPIRMNENSSVISQENSTSVNVVLYNNGNFSLKEQIYNLYVNSAEGLKVKLDIATVIDENYVENEATDLLALTFIDNDSPLKLQSAIFEAEGNNLKLKFNDLVTTEGVEASAIKIISSQNTAISVSALKDNIGLFADSTIFVQFNPNSLTMLHTSEFTESMSVQISNGAVRSAIWNPVQDSTLTTSYIAPSFEVEVVSAKYDESKNRLDVDFNVDMHDTTLWAGDRFTSYGKFRLVSGTESDGYDTVSILNVPSFYGPTGESIRIKVDKNDQERIETAFHDSMEVRLLIETAGGFSKDTYIPNKSGDAIVVDYIEMREDREFVHDPVNTYYSGDKHLLNIAFMPTSSLYNTIDKITINDDDDDQDSVDFRSGRIHFMDNTDTITLPLGMLVSYDSVSPGLFRLPSNEERTLQLMNMDTSSLRVKFEPFTFMNKRDHGNIGAEFAMKIVPAIDAPNYESIVYETDSIEIVIVFDKPIKNEEYITSGILFGGNNIGTVESTVLSADQKTVRLKLQTAITGLSKDPDVEVPAGIFTSIFGASTEALNISSDNYDDVVKGIGRFFWIRDKHKFTRATYQKFCLLRENSNVNVEIYVDIDEWNNTFNQNSLDAFLNMFNTATSGAVTDSLSYGVFAGVQSLYGNVSFNNGGKVVAVLTDVHDNYEVGGNDSNINLFVPGFYESRNSLSVSEYQYSNEKDMFFIDTSPQYWDFADTTGLNTAIEEGTNTSEQAVADIFTRVVLDKINSGESAWAIDGFSGLSQILLTGDYSQFFLNNLGIKPSNSGITPFSGNYNFSTRDNQIASTTFLLYLFENVYSSNRIQFINEYFSDNNLESFDKVSNILNGNITEWFNAYSISGN